MSSAAISGSASPETSAPASTSPKKPARHAPTEAPQENQTPVQPASQRTRTSLRPSGSAGNAGDIIGDYALGETIGKGTFGKVKLGLHLLTGEKVAVKILEKKRIVEVADVERVAREIKILKRNRHVNVIQLFEVIDSPERIFLIMEFVDGGEMFEYIVAHHRIREPEAVALFQQIVDGLDYLHANEVTHRDLKPENLLLQSCASMPTGMLVKIVDFGLSNTHDGGRLLRTACGSPCYAAPEMIQGKLYKGPMADIWSLGVVLFAMVCGYLPFEDSNTNLLYKKILSADYRMPPFLSHAVQDLIRRIFETNPEKRLTTEMIRQHPWFTSARAAVPRPVAAAASYEDPRVRNHILGQLVTVGLDPDDVEHALAHNAHNGLTAAFFLLYNKLLRLKKDQTSAKAQPLPPQQQQHARPAVPSLPVSQPPSGKSDGTPRRPESTAPVSEEVRSTGIRAKEQVPVKAPSTTAVVTATTTPAEAAAAYQRRRASDMTGVASPSHHTVAQPSPRHHAAAAAGVVNQGAPLTARRPSSVRGGRNLVLLTNGAAPPAALVSTSNAPQRPQIPPSAMARPPSQGGSQPQGTRVSISNGMVALTPLFGQKRADAPVGGRRQTIIDGRTSASYVATSTALVTASGALAHHARRRGTETHHAGTSDGVVQVAPTQTPHAPLAPRLSAREEDNSRTASSSSTSSSGSQQRIPPQRPHPPPPTTTATHFTSVL